MRSAKVGTVQRQVTVGAATNEVRRDSFVGLPPAVDKGDRGKKVQAKKVKRHREHNKPQALRATMSGCGLQSKLAVSNRDHLWTIQSLGRRLLHEVGTYRPPWWFGNAALIHFGRV